MDFENLFSKPPNPALGKTLATDSDKRIDEEMDDTEVEETQEENQKWEVNVECEQIPKKAWPWLFKQAAMNEQSTLVYPSGAKENHLKPLDLFFNGWLKFLPVSSSL